MKRYLHKQIEADLKKKMVFVAGARQVGKTTLARQLLENADGYLNWDIPEHREKILKRELPVGKFWVFDEIHKYRGWRNFLKGIYDLNGPRQKVLVTGSAKLDFYRYGGDSLQGRYHFLRLHPLSAAELKIGTGEDLLTLLQLGGFPEPFLSGSEVDATRWSREYRTRLVREDIAGLERVTDLGNMELLMLNLPEKVGNPLSLNSLREDLNVSHKTVANWLNILERAYAIYRISPFGNPKLRAVKKEQKHYHIDWSLVQDPGPRFENMVACHLLKWVHYKQDAQGSDAELMYFRDVDRREVDFVVVEKKKPVLMVECKFGDAEISRGLRYMKARFPDCDAFQISANGKKDYRSPEGIRVCPSLQLLKTLV
jgi:predicted AAA+ superfamily ATPase